MNEKGSGTVFGQMRQIIGVFYEKVFVLKECNFLKAKGLKRIKRKY
jgi:hypothetical protein